MMKAFKDVVGSSVAMLAALTISVALFPGSTSWRYLLLGCVLGFVYAWGFARGVKTEKAG